MDNDIKEKNAIVVYTTARPSDTVVVFNPPELGKDPLYCGIHILCDEEDDHILKDDKKQRLRYLEEIEPGKYVGTPAHQIKYLFDIVKSSDIEPPRELSKSLEMLGENPAKDWALLDVLMEKAQERIAYEVCKKEYEKIYGERSQGGANSWGLTQEEREERNRLMQKEIDRLCLEQNKSYNDACLWISNNISKIYPKTDKLHKCTVKKLTKNPKK